MNLFEHVIQEYSRKRENQIEDQIKHSRTKESSPIGNLIRSTQSKGHKVYLCTDWHLWRCDKKTREIFKRSDFNAIINAYNKVVTPDDVCIFMGDLVDGECEKRKELAVVIQSLSGTKVLVRGNNDLFPDDYYISSGFKYITPRFVYDNILFSHCPATNNNRMNIHGHIHNYKTYWLPYQNHVDVAYLDGRKKPVLLEDVIKAQPEYSKQIKEVPEKFEENVTEYYLIDPYEE